MSRSGIEAAQPPVNPLGRAKISRLRGIGAIAEARCDHHVTTL